MVGGALLALYVAYALNATGLVPHMVFLVDFVARGLGEGIHAERQRAAWSVTPMAFALRQAAGAYGLSALFARDGHYTTLFAVGATALPLSLAIDLGARLAGWKPI